ncbi:MAG: oligopeptide ABC transporter permease [Tumebacillaceae bacterium]
MQLQTIQSGTAAAPLGIKKTNMTKLIWQRFSRNKLAVIGLAFIVIIVLAAILAPHIVKYDYSEQNQMDKLKAPSAAHWLGTDDMGRDIFSRMIYGARVSLTVGVVSVLGTMVIGVTVGALAGYYGGWVDNLLMRFVDIMISFPSIFLLIAVVSILEPSMKNIIIVFAVLNWTSAARLVRGEFLSLKSREYVMAARTIGMSNTRIIFLHMLPNAIAPIIVAATLSIGNTILAESALSFLGIGIQPPMPSWGNMLQCAQDISIMLDAPWYPIVPGLMILLTVVSINFIGDGLRDAFDPRMN